MQQLLFQNGFIQLLPQPPHVHTSTTFESLSKFMSHTWLAMYVRDSTSPFRRTSSASNANSFGLKSSRWPPRTALCLTRVHLQIRHRHHFRLPRTCVRRRIDRTRANNSENANGFTR